MASASLASAKPAASDATKKSHHWHYLLTWSTMGVVFVAILCAAVAAASSSSSSSSSSIWTSLRPEDQSQILPSILLHWFLKRRQQEGPPPPTSGVEKNNIVNDGPANAVYVVGDLHGDVECAKYWVLNRTGLIAYVDDTPYTEWSKDDASASWIWTDPSSSLVFVGDYIDKGPYSRQTLEFVKALTDRFPNHVTALLGNHEFELLLDRDVRRQHDWGGVAFHQFSYATVHPGEYLNYHNINDTTSKESHEQEHSFSDIETVIEALYNASIEVYSKNMQNNVFIKLEEEQQVGSSSRRPSSSILNYIDSPDVRALAQSVLPKLQQQYIDHYRTGTELGTWLEQRPIIKEIRGNMFVHGGINYEVSDWVNKIGGIDVVNEIFRNHSTEDKLVPFMQDTIEGEMIYELLTNRENHEVQSGACEDLKASSTKLNHEAHSEKNDMDPPPRRTILPMGVHRLGVGHTPGYNVRIECDGSFLALDSSLSRWFRNSGNEYCPGQRTILSQNKKYWCNKNRNECLGQIVKIREDHVIEIIE